MEENQNQNENAQTVDTSSNVSGAEKNVIVETIKAKKKLISIVVVAVIALLIILDLLIVSPKETVQKFVKALNKPDVKKAFSYMDYAGVYVLEDLDEDDYDDFWEEYQEFKEDDDYEEMMEYMEEYMDEDFYDDMNEEIEDYTIKVTKITKVKKVAKNLYEVKAKLKMIDEDGEDKKPTAKFYVMKKGLKSYIVAMPDELDF